ncbi:hypothetical protein ACYRFF_00570 [Listeria welshimeri]|uniref:Uncharacterized protein n=1 Tax=Listeria welshimeri TaxID=1643 RepID=A0ABX4IHA9_LISWE|nr:hypothetical protein [Listeria welshimeri]MBC1344787.1 hypothetical protein [Listeria welshimeri]MBC1411019.1 hypothetical protein [Listeria welshimeri]MBC2006938.1 hypothetical protein [Listeria welshimeri]MBC2025895.1 hypothetical protein [Listeria welshimeri]MBS9350120.1 hypothetical protein [Listeria welshimeri]
MKKTILIVAMLLFIMLSFMDIMLISDANISTIIGALLLGAVQTIIVLVPILIIILLVKLLKRRSTN